MTIVDIRPRASCVRLPGGFSLLVRPRSVWVGAGAVLVCLAGVLASCVFGDYPISVVDAVNSVLGDGPRLAELFVMRRRLPRALTAAGVGAALAVAGAVFQSLTRNPLGSPDIVGFGHGAATGAVLVILLFGGGTGPTAIGAFVGGLVTALVVSMLAGRESTGGQRMVLVGIGISSLLIAVNNFMISRAELNDARAATVWIVGSLYERRWSEATLIGLALLVLTPVILVWGRALTLFDLGDDLARGLGVRVGRARAILVTAAVGLTAVATACAGPVAFVALVAPQVARRLTRAAGPNLMVSGLIGATSLVSADLLAQHLISPGELPVGVVTGAVGGVHLTLLLLREWRSGRG